MRAIRKRTKYNLIILRSVWRKKNKKKHTIDPKNYWWNIEVWPRDVNWEKVRDLIN